MALFALVSKDFTRTETGERASEKVRKEARDWDWREEEQIRILNDLPEIEIKYTLVYCTLKCIKEQQNPLEMKKKIRIRVSIHRNFFFIFLLRCFLCVYSNVNILRYLASMQWIAALKFIYPKLVLLKHTYTHTLTVNAIYSCLLFVKT